MALQNSYTDKRGHASNYWRVVAADLDAKGVADMVLGCFKDQASSDAGMEPVLTLRFQWEGADYDRIFKTAQAVATTLSPRDIVLKVIYAEIKTVSDKAHGGEVFDFTTAIDV